jgi:hypothetical protein
VPEESETGGPAPGRRARPARASPAPTGTLDVTAPEDAEVLLDGKRIGRGNVRMSVRAGPHRIVVRRAGATAAERFIVEPGETWTYTVTPTAAP